MILLYFGGAKEKKLEPFIDADVLSELEDWSKIISRDPMIMRELEKIDQEAQIDDQDQTSLKPKSKLRGPRP